MRAIKNTFYSLIYSDDFKNMIYEYKYRNKKYMSHIFSELIGENIKYIVNNFKIDVVIPVPISNDRYKLRGFNQIELILDDLNINYEKIKKVNNTEKMSKLKKQYKKYINIHNSFDVSKKNFDNKKILIVDDIITSGSTMNEIKRLIENEYINTEIYFYSIAISHSYIKNNKNIKV